MSAIAVDGADVDGESVDEAAVDGVAVDGDSVDEAAVNAMAVEGVDADGDSVDEAAVNAMEKAGLDVDVSDVGGDAVGEAEQELAVDVAVEEVHGAADKSAGDQPATEGGAAGDGNAEDGDGDGFEVGDGQGDLHGHGQGHVAGAAGDESRGDAVAGGGDGDVEPVAGQCHGDGLAAELVPAADMAVWPVKFGGVGLLAPAARKCVVAEAETAAVVDTAGAVHTAVVHIVVDDSFDDKMDQMKGLLAVVQRADEPEADLVH